MFARYKAAMRERYRDPATGRYVARLMACMTLYAILLVGVQRVVPLDTMRGAPRYALAALPGIPVAGVFWLIGRYIIELRDEYQRLLEVRKALIATGVAMTLVTIWGFLEMLANAPHLPNFYVPLIWFGGLGVGQCVNTIIEQNAQ